MDSSTSNLWACPFQIEGVSGYFLLKPCLSETPVFNANSVDSDQKPRSAVSDLDLHCLPVSLLWGARYRWVNRQVPSHWRLLLDSNI